MNHRQVGVSTKTVEVATSDDIAPGTVMSGKPEFDVASETLIPAPDDPTFLPPSRHIAVLLRMLADSRVLSLGELDELAAFIEARRARLSSELTARKAISYSE